MIYLDSSVLLAHLFDEARQPDDQLWFEPLISSRLLEFETFSRLHANKASDGKIEAARQILAGVALHEMSRDRLMRALSPFPTSVRTLDGLHLATMDFLRSRGLRIELASYDRRLIEAATIMGFALTPL